MSEDQAEEQVVLIKRPHFGNQEQFDEIFSKTEHSERPQGLCDCRSSNARSSGTTLKRFIFNLFPILTWLPNYSWKEQVVGDLVAGSTVAVMHIPQGMGYAVLAGVSPIVGIYMAFFPGLMYVILGTSHHVSFGNFAVTCLMTSQMIDQYSTTNATSLNETATINSTLLSESHNLEIATAVCCLVGIWQIIMGILRLGVLGIVLSEHLVSGFTTAAAIHVVFSQPKNLLGIDVPRHNGAFKLVWTLKDIALALPTANPAEIVISCFTITFMAVHNDYLKPWYSKIIKFPIPMELIVLIVATLLVKFTPVVEKFDIGTLGYVPTGFPEPKIPRYDIFPDILIDTLAIALVAYVVSLSMAKILARKRGYAIRNNQELFAQGSAQLFGSFFSCMPVATSLSRSTIQEAVGGETQLACVVCCLFLLMIMLWIGPFFESLPLTVISSIIVVSLKGMFLQVRDFKLALRVLPLDAVVWMVTFASVLIVDIDIGLAFGAIASVAVLIYRGSQFSHAVLGHLPGTELFEDVHLYASAVEQPGIKVLRWVGAIHFANAETFRHTIDQHLQVSTDQIRIKPKVIPAGLKGDLELFSSDPLTSSIESHPLECVILDFSGASFIDLTGTKFLTMLYKDLEKSGVVLLIASCPESVHSNLKQCEFFKHFPPDRLIPTVLDAVNVFKRSPEPSSRSRITSLVC